LRKLLPQVSKELKEKGVERVEEKIKKLPKWVQEHIRDLPAGTSRF